MDWNERPSWFDCKHEDSTVKFCVDEETETLGFVLFCERCQSDAVMIEKVSEAQVEQLKEDTFGFLRHELDVHARFLVNRILCFEDIKEKDSERWVDYLKMTQGLTEISDKLKAVCDEELESPISSRCEEEPEAHLILMTTMLMHDYEVLIDMDIHSTYYAAFFASLKNRTLPTNAFWEPKFQFPPSSLIYRRERS